MEKSKHIKPFDSIKNECMEHRPGKQLSNYNSEGSHDNISITYNAHKYPNTKDVSTRNY